MKYVIGLGANLGDREETVERALLALHNSVGHVSARSSWYNTTPLYHCNDLVRSQPDYLNGAVIIDSELDPWSVLVNLMHIEEVLGRVRSDKADATGCPSSHGVRSVLRWQAREIDLDLIAAESYVYRSDSLVVPHPEAHMRDFVLRPLCDVWSDWWHPVLSATASDLLGHLLQQTR